MNINTELICIDGKPNNLHTPILSHTETYIVKEVHDLGYIKLEGISAWYEPNRFIPKDIYDRRNKYNQELQERLEIVNDKKLKDRIYDKTRRKKI